MAKNGVEITPDTVVSTTELAVVLSLSARRVQQLVQDGIITAKQRGKYSLAGSVKRYIKFLQREAEQSDEDIERQKAETSIKKSKAIIAVYEAKELQGKMHRSEDVAAMTEDLIFAIRGALVALPGRVAVDAAASPSEAAEIIRKEVHKVMEELSRYLYDPKKYEERVRDRRNWDIDGWDEDD